MVIMDGRQLNIRCKWKSGQTYLSDLHLNSTVGNLKEQLSSITGIAKEYIIIRLGYPPKIIDINDESRPLTSLPFRSGDTLIVEEDKVVAEDRQKYVDQAMQSQFLSGVKGFLIRKVVPADNSCLFTSINSLMDNGKVDPSRAPELRKLIARIVMGDPKTYNDAFLGKPNDKYCNWIQKPDSWGGGIELSILCSYFQVEIDIVDTQTGRIDRFGEDKYYKERILLIYNGIHYDPLVMEPVDSTRPVEYKFSTSDESVLAQAMELASEAKESRQYTDVCNFSLRCLICQKPLQGTTDAESHAKKTGHINFGEYI
ncbi:ubiquitin thioesterase OTU1-like isoform X2 [Gigantopelta aegis]|uniref:ubiquitin thioesterase OTU1-like isoform X2 n=1 Tax=Gigantopelta aegis TaxID=1735272 RepID=UPI001B88B77A|nr:ubiquitin thioesterase OTU1-like isoform X2 [Gigantopelta aegis]